MNSAFALGLAFGLVLALPIGMRLGAFSTRKRIYDALGSEEGFMALRRELIRAGILKPETTNRKVARA